MKLLLPRLLTVIFLFGIIGFLWQTHSFALPPVSWFCWDWFLDLGEDIPGCYDIIVPAICGDGRVEGDEMCDDWENNGTECVAEYWETCEYCDQTCQTISVSWWSCGDGIVQEEFEQCEGEIYVRRSLFSESMCSSIAYGETCSECNTKTCQTQVVEGPKCGDWTIDAVVCAGWFDGENSATSTTWPDFGTNVWNTPRYISNDDECDTDSIDGLEWCAVYDGSSFYSCRGTCSQGICQTAPQEVSVEVQARILWYESIDLSTLCFYHKTGLLENWINQLAWYTYHWNWMGSIGDSEEIIDLDEACSDTVIPSEECDDGSKNWQLCSGDGCTYCSSSCTETKRSGWGSPSSISSATFISTIQTKTKETDENEKSQEEENIQQEETEEESKTQDETSETTNDTKETNSTECYEKNYIIERFSKLSLIPTEEIVTVPEAFQQYFSNSFMTSLNNFIIQISWMEAQAANAVIERVVCKIETAKAKNWTKHQNTGYESGGSAQGYILQYIQDRVILLYNK